MKEKKERFNGVFLIVIGVFALLNTLFDWGNLGFLILPGLAALFILWGIVSRSSGLFIPGGILAGIGFGTFLVADPLSGLEHGIDDGALFMLSFAAGWVLIPVLSVIFTEDKHWWALIPAGIMALIGTSILIGGIAETALNLAGKFWPLILIILGLYALLEREKIADSGKKLEI